MSNTLAIRFKVIGPYKGEWGIIYTRKPGKFTLATCEGLLSERFQNREEARTWYRHNILGKHPLEH